MKIAIHHLDKTYRGGVHALYGATLNIEGGMFGLLGPNGAGKTTLMRILAGILHPTNGMQLIGDYDGNSEHDRNAIKRMLGYLPQDFGVYPDLSAREFLDYRRPSGKAPVIHAGDEAPFLVRGKGWGCISTIGA